MKKVSIFLFFVAMIASSNACYGNNSGPKKYVDSGLPSGTLYEDGTYSLKDTDLNKVTSDSHLKRRYSIDVRQMDFSIKFNVVRFKKDAKFRKDYWFSEVGELVTDNKWWTSGRYKSDGYYTYHRFNSTQYTCTFLDQGYVKGEDGYGGNVNYGVALRDVPRSSLPEENGYYVLDLRDWEGYVPLYFPYSNEYILENFNKGDIIFEYYE